MTLNIQWVQFLSLDVQWVVGRGGLDILWLGICGCLGRIQERGGTWRVGEVSFQGF